MIPANLLPPEYQAKAFIAGGFAACPALASDIDVWVLTRDTDARAKIIANLVHQRLVDGGLRYKIEPEHSPPYGQRWETLRVAVVDHAPPIQILVTRAPDVRAVLDDFDISTHQIAITADQGIIKGRAYTRLNETPVQLRHDPASDERMAKIEARYRLWRNFTRSPSLLRRFFNGVYYFIFPL